ncbi:hypothetical protein PT974_09887 [Cladobotryum mycophilum]|uniref:Uncharacterized protein n=1 Tax=Cladobotryum mycophilum TaxID=491253 RepID=A0ABR0SHG4_9HYPO
MVKILQKHGINHYKLYTTPSSLRQIFQADLDKTKPNEPGRKMANFDVTATYYRDDPEKLRNSYTDPEWLAKHVEPEKSWVDTERGRFKSAGRPSTWRTIRLPTPCPRNECKPWGLKYSLTTLMEVGTW